MENKKFGRLLDFEGLKIQPNTSGSDFKAEVVAAGLVEQGYNPEKIRISRKGAGKRGYATDIDSISLQYSKNDLSDYLQIDCNREAIYDILPEGVFHKPVNKRLNPDKEDILHEITVHREEEFLVRKFFRLFEIELDSMLTDIALFEAEFDKRITYPKYVRAFRSCWQVINLLDREQAVMFLHTVPILHRIRNSFAEMEESLSLILGVPVTLEKIILVEKETEGFAGSELGKCKLGVSFIPGTVFNDGMYDIKIKIGPMSALKMKAFLKGETADRILDSLCEIFLPGNVFTSKEYILVPEDSVFILSSENADTWLGVNAYI